MARMVTLFDIERAIASKSAGCYIRRANDGKQALAG